MRRVDSGSYSSDNLKYQGGDNLSWGAERFYEIVLKDCLLSFIATLNKRDDFYAILSEFLDNWEDLWVFDLTNLGVRIEKKDSLVEALKAFYDANWRNEEAVKLLKDVESMDIEKEEKSSITLSIKKCPYREFHEDLKAIDISIDLCLFGAFVKRGTQRFMKNHEEKKRLKYTYAFNLPEKPCTLTIYADLNKVLQ